MLTEGFSSRTKKKFVKNLLGARRVTTTNIAEMTPNIILSNYLIN